MTKLRAKWILTSVLKYASERIAAFWLWILDKPGLFIVFLFLVVLGALFPVIFKACAVYEINQMKQREIERRRNFER
jgi:hypothetical protein